ncbi:hypothetical protein CV100_18025 [Stenotrophomonas maltophilia]|uniref:Uncharacterized protein n=1 Tax=Stenotrophomonas maltophilia TaxID=40324 RepID=A0A2W6JBU2_STEMA|nr:hypothetical protein CV100_18025 [Stenotrophomonas maltophilia]PZS93315.1 hypothetical protein A7X83_05835 [Stenotrophomonas maltophilia]
MAWIYRWEPQPFGGCEPTGHLWVRTLVRTLLPHDRWDGIALSGLARLDGLMIEPKGRGAMC